MNLTPQNDRNKIIVLGITMAFTLAIHYGYVIQPIFGHVRWIHALHGRFCYIPIVIAAAWFGLRGGLLAATTVSVLVLPIILGPDLTTDARVSESVEIIFYYFIGGLIGWLVDREYAARKSEQEAQLQVERTQKLSLVGQLAAGVAHEIKNPLSSIKGAADILVDDSAPSEARKEFKEILLNEVRRINSTVTEFLKFARPKVTRLQRIDLQSVVASSVRQVAPQAEQSGIAISHHSQDELYLNGDDEKLHQMLLNLLLNAVHATGSGGTIKVTAVKSAADEITLKIEDSGKGMSTEDIQQAFDPFFTTRSDGTGLGLAIVKSIVEDHHGQITLSSEVGRGAVVAVRFPCLKKEAAG